MSFLLFLFLLYCTSPTYALYEWTKQYSASQNVKANYTAPYPGAFSHGRIVLKNNIAYVLGGYGYTSSATPGYLSDTFQYHLISGTWTLIKANPLNMDVNMTTPTPGVTPQSTVLNYDGNVIYGFGGDKYISGSSSKLREYD